MSSQEHNIKLPIISGSFNASLARLWNSMTGKNPARISQILEMMNHKRLFSFLKYMHQICLHDHSIGYSRERLEKYQFILTCCRRDILTRFLLSTDEECVVNLLERCNVIWTTFFVGLIENRRDNLVKLILNFLMIHHGFPFISNLVLLLIREASNQVLPHNLRQQIFDFVCRNVDMVMIIVQSQLHEVEHVDIEGFIGRMNQWASSFARTNGLNCFYSWNLQMHDSRLIQQEAIKRAEVFVERNFPSQHPLNPNHDYHCVVCRSSSGEPTDDGNPRIIRMLTCCSALCKDPNDMKYACHQCLVEWAKACNTPDPTQERKRTSNFSCPNCRYIIPFFP